MVAGARAERAKGPKGNAIGLNGTVNLPTCDLQAAKVAAKSGPRPSADVPQLFLAIFRSFCSAPMHLPWIFFVLSASARWNLPSPSLDAISPETNHDSLRGNPRPRPESYWPCRASIVGTVELSSMEPCLSPPLLSVMMDNGCRQDLVSLDGGQQ